MTQDYMHQFHIDLNVLMNAHPTRNEKWTRESFELYGELHTTFVNMYFKRKFPTLFFDDLIDFGPPLGWMLPVHDSCVKLAAYSNDIKIQQVKEKFGGLRIYVSIDDKSDEAYNEAYNIIAEAEHQCATRCQECGAPGKKISKEWIRVACPIHE